jgi:glucose/arabinose dehydrogenase
MLKATWTVDAPQPAASACDHLALRSFLRRVLASIGIFTTAGLVWHASAMAQGFETVRIASGLDRPLYLTTPANDSSQLFVLEQHSGNIMRVDRNSGAVASTPFLTIGGLATENEQGLLGLAFDPDYAVNGFFYTNHTDSSGTTQITRYQRSGDPTVADSTSATPILSYSQPQANHNGGWMGFGPDGMLYVASGDGGGGNDDDNGHTAGIGNAQDLTGNLLGKMLRIDVSGDDFPGDPSRNYAIPTGNPFVGSIGDDEIWAYGLRNPWRASFDRDTGDLYIGDVGQNAREEVNFQPAGDAGGTNYGWRLREGTTATPGVGGAAPANAVTPIYDYAHGNGDFQGDAVTGGYVYRGPIDELNGEYFFADFINQRIWSLTFDGSDAEDFDGSNFSTFIDWTDVLIPDVGSIGNVASFGEDSLGNLYIVDLDGDIFTLRAVPLPAPALLMASALLVVARLRRSPRHVS